MDEPSGDCEHCGRAFEYRLIHNGFNDTAYGYCDKCSFTVLLSCWSEAAERAGLRVHQRISAKIEELLKACPCGGLFRAAADPKCPYCSRPLSATKATAYIEKNAPGTLRGWRWGGTWSGLYSIVLNGKVVEDWWNDQAL